LKKYLFANIFKCYFSGHPARVRDADILAQIECFAYNKRTISSHVTGEKTIPPQVQKIAAGIGKRWASTGKREISSAVRLGSPNGKYD